MQLALEASEISVVKMTAKLWLPDEEPKDQPKRRPIPDHIPRQEIELITGDEDCTHCDGALWRLGEDVTEELECVPGVQHLLRTDGSRCLTIVNRIVQLRMACSGCDAFTQVALPTRSNAAHPGPGLLAHVLVGRYADHLPLYRQARSSSAKGLIWTARRFPTGSASPRRC